MTLARLVRYATDLFSPERRDLARGRPARPPSASPAQPAPTKSN